MSRRRVLVVDVLGEVRRAMRVLRRVERFLVQEQRHKKRSAENARKRAAHLRAAADLDDGLPL